MLWRRDFDQQIGPKIFNFNGDWRDLPLVEVSSKDDKKFWDIVILSFF